MRLEIEPLIILELFLQLDWSPPVVNSIDWTWFGKAHTCLYKRFHSWRCMSEQKPGHEVEGNDRSPPGQECVGTDLEKGTKKYLQHWRSPRTQWPPSFLNGRSLEPPRLFLELAARPNWAIGVEGRWPRTRWSLWQSSRVPLDNHLCSTPPIRPFMVEWPDGSHSSV